MTSFTLTTQQRKDCEQVMKTHSVTYWNATRFFPQNLRDQVITVYRWVREADEIVDNPKEDPTTALESFIKEFEQAWQSNEGPEEHTLFVQLAKSIQIEKSWCDAFLNSMLLDLTKQRYQTWQELDNYVFGSAEVIGLMMSRILEVPDSAFPAAQALGRWMQYVNFLRDVNEDIQDRNRVYLPKEFLDEQEVKVSDLKKGHFTQEKWQSIVKAYCKRLNPILNLALSGIADLPRWSRFPILLATNLYQWALGQIIANPQLVWEKQVRPTPAVILECMAPTFWQLTTGVLRSDLES